MKFLPLLILAFAISQSAFAESFVCPRETPVYDAAGKQLGTFKKETELDVARTPNENQMCPVVYHGENGATVNGFCKVSDLTASSTLSTPETTASSAPEGKFEWLTDLAKAQKFSKDRNQLLLMDFTGSDWCGWCKKLDREVFDTPEFKNYAAKNLTLLKVDFPHHTSQSAALKKQNQDLQGKYSIEGYPTIVVLNSKGGEAGRLGYMEGGPKAFIAELDKLKK